jgi:3-carboxy-cis,cis-muconate cycloisomerase
VREAVDDASWLQAMLDVEAALARAEARAGAIPAEHAEAIARACRAEAFDIAAIGAEAAETGNPVVPLVRALSAAVGGAAGGNVHRGATSQDIVDSATMLVARRATGLLLEDLGGAAHAAAGLAAAHRTTMMPGRTLLQQALPTTFGLKAAGWLVGLDRSWVRLRQVRRMGLAVQLGGAVGTLASLGEAGPAILRDLAEELGLAEPTLPWHTERTRIAELAGALGEAAGALGKPALDVTLLAQTEVAEVREGAPGRGGSSTLPHKHNPIAAVSAVACARQAPGLVSTLLGSMGQEHERAAGAWHAEWKPLRELFVTVGSAAAWLRDCLEHLEIDPLRMRSNLDLTHGLVLAERVTLALSETLGHREAHEVVERASRRAAQERRPLSEILPESVAEEPDVTTHLDLAGIAALLDPAGYLGSASVLVSRALDAHRAVLADADGWSG